jgi:hypothetical protein
MTMWRMRIACWIPKATNTHLEYIILIPFPLQQWLQEYDSMLRYTYTAAWFNSPFLSRILLLSLAPGAIKRSYATGDRDNYQALGGQYIDHATGWTVRCSNPD